MSVDPYKGLFQLLLKLTQHGVDLTLIESVQLTPFGNSQRRVKKTLAKESI